VGIEPTGDATRLPHGFEDRGKHQLSSAPIFSGFNWVIRLGKVGLLFAETCGYEPGSTVSIITGGKWGVKGWKIEIIGNGPLVDKERTGIHGQGIEAPRNE